MSPFARSFITVTVMVWGLSLLGGCASTATYQHQHSLAWNVTHAAGVSVNDIPASKVGKKAQFSDNGQLTSAVSNTAKGAALAGATGVALGVPFSSLSWHTFSPALGLLFAANLFSPENPASMPLLLAWIPRDTAHDASDAQEQMMTRLKNVAESALPEGYSFSGKHVLYTPDFINSQWMIQYPIKGPMCGGKIKCTYSVVLYTPLEQRAPEWLGGKKAYAFIPKSDGGHPDGAVFLCKTATGRDSVTLASSLKRCRAFFNDVEVSVSAHLPKQIYEYRPPSKWGLPMPYVLSQGKIYAFISPSKH